MTGSGDNDFGKITAWVLSKWDKGSFDTVEESVRYHWLRHGMMKGKTPTEYADDALRYFEENKDLHGRLEPIKSSEGELGWRIYKGPEEPVGIYTSRGKIVTFRYEEEV